jgi:hypothetical protein
MTTTAATAGCRPSADKDAACGSRTTTPGLRRFALDRTKHAEAEGWLGEIEGIHPTLTFLRDKRAEGPRVRQREPIHPGLPAVGSRNRS